MSRESKGTDTSSQAESYRRLPGAKAHRAHRPVSLDIDTSEQHATLHSAQRQRPQVGAANEPSSAPAAFKGKAFFEDLSPAGSETHTNFALSVNVDCSPHETVADVSEEDPPALMLAESAARGVTSVSLTLRPPSAEPLPPIDVSSRGPSLACPDPSGDPRSFQSSLRINLGHAGGASPSRHGAPALTQRPTSLGTLAQIPTTASRPPGLPMGPPSQLSRPTATASAPTTPSGPAQPGATLPSSLPSTPLRPPEEPLPTTSRGAIPRTPRPGREESELPPDYFDILDQVEYEFQPMVRQQLIAKYRLVKALEEEVNKLEELRREIDILSKPSETKGSPKEVERQLRSEVYQLQLECDRLAREVDLRSDRRVPLGETNEEFYQSIYTGQQYLPQTSNYVQPSAFSEQASAIETEESDSSNQGDGPPWVCLSCTFKNHPLMDKCEECGIPRLIESAQGMTVEYSQLRHESNPLSDFPSTSR